MPAVFPDPKMLRRQIIDRRLALDDLELRATAVSAARIFWRQVESNRCHRIGVYYASRGELNCAVIIQEAWARAREVYLPVLHRGALSFAPYRPGEPMVRNRFGIPEPAAADGRALRPADLDLVLTPLVAFDDSGTRLGMGGGFYDRSFHFLKQRRKWRKPCLVGVGYEFQHVPRLERNDWDIPVQCALTERAFYRF
ncbi:MAG: 5-formyltetrahydrofolate cyclo-ligase [Gammaproteobacteria bacterium]|nr:5-formyltetrahydrofolate cyclo-ligase [Gammaproteobacteria bacterium]